MTRLLEAARRALDAMERDAFHFDSPLVIELREAIELLKTDLSYGRFSRVARKTGMTKGMVWLIATGRNWRHVTCM